jgi:M6 family metalloprotease-like protein
MIRSTWRPSTRGAAGFLAARILAMPRREGRCDAVAFLVLILIAALGLATAPGSLGAQATSAVTGTLTAVWGDPPPESTADPVVRWHLSDDRGRQVEVELPAELLRRAGGVRAVDRRRVTASGVLMPRPGGTVRDRAVLRVTGLRVVGEPPSAWSHAPPQLGSRPYAVLLCSFTDRPAEPRPPSFFEALMGGGYPNMDHYYREMSGGRMDLAGTRVFGWFPVPRPHDAYFDSGTGGVLLYRLADDCIAAADRHVDFASFSGIILQFNGQLSRSGQGMAWGGSRVLALDGPERVWPVMWMPLWAVEQSRYGIYAHEIGHTLGLPHSSGPYEQTYDSSWDVMSRPYLRWESGLNAWVPGGTIAFHKDLLGWLPDPRRVTLADAAGAPVRLDAHTAPAGGGGVLLVRIAIPGTPDFYTVEARRRAGYDRGLPGEAVILHRVPDPDGPDCTLHRCAEVIDRYGNGDPNDAGAMWLPGDTFDDGVVRVSVTGATDTGWELVVSVTVPPTPAGLTVARAADALFHGGRLNAGEIEYLDAMGNRNGRYDLGDFLAFVRRHER